MLQLALLCYLLHSMFLSKTITSWLLSSWGVKAGSDGHYADAFDAERQPGYVLVFVSASVSSLPSARFSP